MRVLQICYYFPPMGGAGIGRPLALCKYLPDHGISCDVLTVKPVAYRVYEPELLNEIPSEIIYRAGSRDPQRILYLLGARKLSGRFIERGRSASDKFFPDPKIGWVRSAIRLGRELLSGRRYDAIISTSPPMSSHLVAQRLSKETSIPWIADFRDYWTSYKVEQSYSSRIMVERGLKLLDSIKKEATVLTAASSPVADYLGKAVSIPNSYDSELAELWKAPESNDSFVIGLFGTFDELSPVEPLLILLAKLREENRPIYDLVRIRQVGSIDSSWLFPQLKKHGLEDKIDLHGFMPRKEAIEALADVSVFYLGLSDRLESSTDITPGRVYYILASGRPILAALPSDSSVGRILKETDNSFYFDPNDCGGAVEWLTSLINRRNDGEQLVQLLPEYAKKYSSEVMVNAFAEIIRDVTSR